MSDSAERGSENNRLHNHLRLLGPSINQPIAMAYVRADLATPGQRLQAIVRGKPVPMEVVTMPFVPHRYHRG